MDILLPGLALSASTSVMVTSPQKLKTTSSLHGSCYCCRVKLVLCVLGKMKMPDIIERIRASKAKMTLNKPRMYGCLLKIGRIELEHVMTFNSSPIKAPFCIRCFSLAPHHIICSLHKRRKRKATVDHSCNQHGVTVLRSQLCRSC